MPSPVIQRGGEIVVRMATHSGDVVGVEVGVWDGRLSEYLLGAMPRLTLHMVDRWRPPDSDSSYAKSGAEIAGYELVDHAVAKLNATGRVDFAESRAVFHVGESLDIARQWAASSADFVFIDADHSYNAVLADMSAWWPAVKQGGWLCGHDWDNRPDVWGVRRAVEDFVDSIGTHLRVEIGADHTWFLRKHD